VTAVATLLDVDKEGKAIVDHTITLRVRGAPLRFFDMQGVDSDAAPLGEATVTQLNEKDTAAQSVSAVDVAVRGGGVLRVTPVALTKGLGRGSHQIHLRYQTDLRTSGHLTRNGSRVRTEWLGPTWPNGIDNVTCTFWFPPGLEAPKPGGDAPDDSDTSGLTTTGAYASTVRRQPTRDEIELLRPHVAQSEQVRWVVLVDPPSLSGVSEARSNPLPAARIRAAVQSSPVDQRVFLAVATGLFLLFWSLASLKHRDVQRLANEGDVVIRPFLRLPHPLRTLLAGILVSAGVALQVCLDTTLLGSGVLVLAMLALAYRTPVTRSQARAPGHWHTLAARNAFAVPTRRAGSFLDITTAQGKAGAVGLATAVLLASLAAHGVSSYFGFLTGLDGLVFLPLLLTGCRGAVPHSPAHASARFLKRVARELRHRHAELHVLPWARVPHAQQDLPPDELRLRVVLPAPLPGLISMEVGCLFVTGWGGFTLCPTLLVRCEQHSVAAMQAHALPATGSWKRGRNEHEQVLLFEPTSARPSELVSLLLQLTTALSTATATATLPAVKKASSPRQKNPTSPGVVSPRRPKQKPPPLQQKEPAFPFFSNRKPLAPR